MKYYEVFGGNGYHSAFMTTYAFSARAFEDVPLPRLRGAGCRNITVLADRGMLNTSFEEFDPPRYAGTLYHVVKATMPGAFHSKITLLVGAERGRLLIGSANLTALGLGGNRELIADVHHTPEMREFAPLFGQIMHYIESHVPEDDPWFVSARDRALQDASWLRTAIREDATPLPDLRLVFDRPEDTILDQVTAAIGSDMIERLIVLSPYWDVGLDGLRQLRSAIGTPATDLLLQPSAGLFPVDSLDGNDDLHLFDIDATDSTRFVHAKLFVALGEAWDHVISGSMNCSVPALLGPEVPHGNAEAGVYRRVPRGEALAALGLEGYRDRPVEIAELPEFQKRERTMPERTVPADAGNFELRGVELFWRPPRYSNLSPVEIRLFNRDHEELPQVLHIDDSSSNKWMIDPELDRPRVACIIGGDGTWSTPTSIVDLEVLSISTRPRQRGRKRILIDSLDDRYPEDLTLLEVFNELEALTVSERNRSRVSAPTRGTAVAQMDSEPTYRVLPYEAFVAARNRARPEHRRPVAMVAHTR